MRRVIERPDACADLRGRRVRGEREEATVVRAHFDRLAGAGMTFDARDGTGEDPRMPQTQRLLAPRRARTGRRVSASGRAMRAGRAGRDAEEAADRRT